MTENVLTVKQVMANTKKAMKQAKNEEKILQDLLKKSNELKDKSAELIGKSYVHIYYGGMEGGNIQTFNGSEKVDFLDSPNHYVWFEMTANEVDVRIKSGCDMFSYMDNEENVFDWTKSGKFVAIVKDNAASIVRFAHQLENSKSIYIVKVEE